MAEEKLINSIKKDFSFLKNENVLGVLLFGSYAKREKGARDVDICIVAPKEKSANIMKKVYRNMDVGSKKYDVYCFEELPLYMKWEVINRHEVLFAKDEGELYEYFYYFRKLYADQKHRMEMTRKEILDSIHPA